MSNILDDNNMNDTGAGHSALAISRLKTIGSRSRLTAIIQMSLYGILILLCLYALVAGASILSNLSSMARRGGGIDLEGMGSLIFAVVGLVLVLLGLYFFASFKLMNYGAKITEFTETGNPQTFEAAVSDRKVYFMITVIFSIIMLLLNLYATFAMPILG
jgi:hypothetical protein